MATPSSQIVATWVVREIVATNWVPLADLCFAAVRRNWPTPSEEELWELIETYLSHVAEHLRNEVAQCAIDGTTPTFEIDNDPRPYIRSREFPSRDIYLKFAQIDPFDLELISAEILKKLGGVSHVTKRTKDGGIDFIGVNLSFVPPELSVPMACRFAVIGQAKCYKEGNVRQCYKRDPAPGICRCCYPQQVYTRAGSEHWSSHACDLRLLDDFRFRTECQELCAGTRPVVHERPHSGILRGQTRAPRVCSQLATQVISAGSAPDRQRGVHPPALLRRRRADPHHISALSPPLVIEQPHTDRILGVLGDAIRAEAA